MSGQILTTSEVAEDMRVSVKTVLRLCEHGQLVGAYRTKPGGHWRIPRAAVERLKASTRPVRRTREAN